MISDRIHQRKRLACFPLALLMLLVCLSASAQQEIEEYRIGAGDVVDITVFGEDDLSPNVKVTEQGQIIYPFLGELQVAGMTTAELRSEILNGLKGPYLIDPKVSVSIASYRSFYINGQIKNPGGYGFEPGLTVRKAISLAGGLTERASVKKIFIVPENAPSDTEGRRVDLESRVMPGDIITIQESFF